MRVHMGVIQAPLHEVMRDGETPPWFWRHKAWPVELSNTTAYVEGEGVNPDVTFVCLDDEYDTIPTRYEFERKIGHPVEWFGPAHIPRMRFRNVIFFFIGCISLLTFGRETDRL